MTIEELRFYKSRYWAHRDNAKKRKIPFLITFTEWLKVWVDSGHLHQRGRKCGQYCMARFGDVGPYAVGNVQIILSSENVKETLQNPGGDILRAKRKINGIGNQNKKGKKEGAATRAKKSISHLGVKPTEETRLLLKQRQREMWAPGGVLRVARDRLSAQRKSERHSQDKSPS